MRNALDKTTKRETAEGGSSRRAMVGGHGAERRDAAEATKGPELSDD